MKRFTDAVRQALTDMNWFGALFIALALPDICGALETPNRDAGERYRDWFDRYLAEKYMPHFSAQDCYSFRCACLHQGLTTNAKSSIARIHFVEPHMAWPDHLTKVESGIVMEIDDFCLDICDGVERWSVDVKDNEEIQERRWDLIDIHWIQDDLNARAVYG